MIKAGARAAQKFSPGDPVICSFISCSACRSCRTGHPAYCKSSTPLNVLARKERYTLDGTDTRVIGLFFGQSSFANVTIVSIKSALLATPLLKDPSSNEELKLFAPLGCGLLTGAGAVVNVGGVKNSDEVVVIGVGGVGLGALMAAKVKGVKRIVAVDKVESRLELARSLGATQTINTTEIKDLTTELPAKLKELSEEKQGVTMVVDTTAYLPLVNAAVQSLAVGGQLLLVGIPSPGSKLELELTPFFTKGASVKSVRLGDAEPWEFIPVMISWYRQGLLPLEKFSKFYSADDVNKAIDDMLNGTTVKPILVW